jgi:uncharacterized protein YegL
MALLDEVEIPRKTMVLFFIVDTSGSMEGKKIGAVNIAIKEVLPEIAKISDENADALIKIAALEFSSGATWITASGPVEADKFRWNNLDAAGVTDLGAACKALNEKLSTKAFMQAASGSFAPALFLLSDGAPTDDWKRELEKLKQNNWFKASVKVALAIGDDADKNVLKEFTNSMEAVLECHDSKTLVKMIKFLAVTSSQVASKSSNAVDPAQSTGDGAKQEELNQAITEIREEVAETPDSGGDDW